MTPRGGDHSARIQRAVTDFEPKRAVAIVRLLRTTHFSLMDRAPSDPALS